VVFIIKPFEPTDQPVFELIKKQDRRYSSVSLFCVSQLVPPSVVFKIVPPVPTVHPVFSSMKQIVVNGFPCGRGFCQNH